MAKGSKGSPKSKSPKGSPKGSKKGSPKDKSSPKSKKSNKNQEPEKPPAIVNLRKHNDTNDSLAEYVFADYRCPQCYLVLDGFMRFINHECWRSFYLGKMHFGETQAYACRTCDRVYQNQHTYDRHICDKYEAESVLPITYRNHFQFYMYWDRRIESERKYFDTDWQYVCRCVKCGNKFKRLILYILHSCFQYSLLKPIEVKCLKICYYCKFIFVSEKQYNIHLPYCQRKDRAYCNDLINTSFLRCVQQFVIGRHCYDFDLHITQKPLENSDITNKPLPVGCETCGLIQTSILEYLYHPCIAGKLIAPADLEMILLCNKCRCLFINYESCEEHLKHCETQVFTFVRFNTKELNVALERWITDVQMNPFLPKRPNKMRCQYCEEIFCDLKCAFKHGCPKQRRYERALIPPISLSELYICNGCGLLLFSATESVNHAEKCIDKPLMIQIHPDLEEAVTALEVWSRLPRLLQMEIYIGMPSTSEKCPRRSDDVQFKCETYCQDLCENYNELI